MQQPLCFHVCEYILWQKRPPEFYCKSIWGFVKSKTKKNISLLTNFDKVAPCFTWCWSFTRAGANFTPFQQAAYRPHAKHNKMVMTVWGNSSPKILGDILLKGLLQYFATTCLAFFKTWLMCIWIFCTVLHWSTHWWFHFAKSHHFGHRSWGCCLVTLKRFVSWGPLKYKS